MSCLLPSCFHPIARPSHTPRRHSLSSFTVVSLSFPHTSPLLIKGGLKKASARTIEPKKQDTRGSMMDAIKGGAFKLKKREPPKEEDKVDPSPSAGGGVAGILARRIAIMGSDDEDDTEEDSSDNSDWD